MNKKYLITGVVVGFFTPLLIFLIVATIKFRFVGNDVIIVDTPLDSPRVKLENLSVTDLNNMPVTISDYKEDVVLVDFWATWCSPCISQFPFYERLQRVGNIRILAISDQKIETLKRFKRKYNYTFTFLKSIKELQEYNIVAIPHTLILYKEGGIYKRMENPDSTKVMSILKKLKNVPRKAN